MAQGYVKAVDLPQVIPVFPLPGAILLPRGQLPLNIFEPRYLNMIDDAMAGERMLGMIQPTGGTAQLPSLSAVGCAGRITSFAETSDGRYLITLTGIARFRITTELPSQTPYRQVRAAFAPFEADLSAPHEGEAFDRPAFLAGAQALSRAPPARDRLGNRRGRAAGSPDQQPVDGPAVRAGGETGSAGSPALDDRVDVLTALMRIDAAEMGDGDTPTSMQ